MRVMNEFIKIWNIKNALIMQITTTEMTTVDAAETRIEIVKMKTIWNS